MVKVTSVTKRHKLHNLVKFLEAFKIVNLF